MIMYLSIILKPFAGFLYFVFGSFFLFCVKFEYRINVNPIVLGGGIPLFKGIKKTMPLKLLAAKAFQSGVVGLHYQTIKE